MTTTLAHQFVSANEIRNRFSRLMSDMYRTEVPQYGTLVDLVNSTNAEILQKNAALRLQLAQNKEIDRLSVERHGAIRLGTAAELFDMRRIFAVMGMHPVGYYDLTVAGVPVHSTCFRPVDEAALAVNPFRVFTSLLRLELINDPALRAQAADILAKRRIFTHRALELVALCEAEGGLSNEEATEFVTEVRETFRWHSEATVSHNTYQALLQAHRLVADVVCFKGPHINHLTPRSLDIDTVQIHMPAHGMNPKEVIEGPPARRIPILLRQTSFKALSETITFQNEAGSNHTGSHTARFGEVEQRGAALTPKGRALYDQLLHNVRTMEGKGNDNNATAQYEWQLKKAFATFPDDLHSLRTQGLAYFRYQLTHQGVAMAGNVHDVSDMDLLIQAGLVMFTPIVYEDFLPVSAAGIFQSNLGSNEQRHYDGNAAKHDFEQALGAAVLDEFALYEQLQQASMDAVRHALQRAPDGH
ncbi:VOC family protein [Curvibacter sp. CHRR-16]|uniref:2-oxoadipate dioxygenase/decarboxylase HglS n=1 Tax=Curvibacter sp. CHRR-16 TaxID=2835872 RepID=UPI001BDA2FD0|nr:VOC family protein [Curvibacter sp. CHRR-16]MBT0570761.1 VOC family protein [Curvibacter sp. CHRR-16]